MPSNLCSNISKICSLSFDVLAYFLFVFGFYVTLKTILSARDEFSVIAITSMVVGVAILMSSIVDDVWTRYQFKEFQIVSHCCYTILISLCAATILLSQKYKQNFETFFSHEISILWTLRDSSILYQKIIIMLQSLVDCCKFHSVVDKLIEI